MINILAVDDDLDFHEILKIKLPTSEFNLTLTSSEKEFFEKMDSGKFDLFLLDLSIDDHPLKGIEILVRIRQDKQLETPVIVLSNSNSKKTNSSALELGANDFVNKPIDGKLLISKIKALIDGSQAFSKELEFGTTPDKLPEIQILAKFRLVSISDIGLVLESSAYVAKGSKVKLCSDRIKEIFGVKLIEVYSNGFDSEVSGVYRTTFEIDPEDKDLISKAKLWIKAHKK